MRPLILTQLSRLDYLTRMWRAWLLLATSACGASQAPATAAPHETTLAPGFTEHIVEPGEQLGPFGGCAVDFAIVREGSVQVGAERLGVGDAVRFGPSVALEQRGDVRTVVLIGHNEPAACEARFGVARAVPEGPFVTAGGKLRVTLLFDGTDAPVSLAMLDGDPDVGVPEHVHESSAEILFIEDGEGAMRVGEAQIEVRPGAAIVVPPATLHDLRPSGARPLRAFQMYDPAGPEQRFRPAEATP